MLDNIDPVVLLKPEGIFSLKNPKTRIFLLVTILLCLILAIYIGIQLIINELKKPKILAYVNNEPIGEKFLKDKMTNVCLVEKSDSKSQALEKWIDFLVLRQGAKKLGVDISEAELHQKISEKGAPKLKTCPEEYQSLLLIPKIKEVIMPTRKVEILIAKADQKKAIEQIVKAYNSTKNLSLRNTLSAIAPQATPSSTVIQSAVTADTDRTGIFEDETVFNEVFKLKKEEISSILSPQKGYALNKLVLIRVFDATDKNSFPSFTEWFTAIKRQTKIQKYN